MTKTIIITAGGIGKRMGSDIPKQFIELNGLPILMHTINQFYEFDKKIEIIVVLPKAHLNFWNDLILKFNFTITHKVVIGGDERYCSIKNGLKIASNQIIGVHDGVRPLVSQTVINEVYNSAEIHGAVIPVINLKESIREIGGSESKSVDRNLFKVVQTPQCFKSEIIKKAYLQEFSNQFTDDASVVEKNGHNIHLIKGNDENIKITIPIDLQLAKLLLKR
jgi:2-C-methyl-D-erythritol 4-phosphate cytidylyltransferase